MPNPTVVSDIEARFRSLTDDEQNVAQAFIDDAWAVMLATVPDIDNRMATGTLAEETVRFVIAAMVVRVLRNPNGVRQWSVDDYSETRDSALSAGTLYVSDAEAALLNGRAVATLPKALSVCVSEDVDSTTGYSQPPLYFW